MEKRRCTQLAIYEVKDEVKLLSFEIIKELLIKKPSGIVYVMKDGRLYGIICLGDILHRKGKERVTINTNFLFLTEFNMLRAKEIMAKKKNIHKIPVVDVMGKLLAEYSRWDDNFFVERNYKWFEQREFIEKILRQYKMVYIIEPANNTNIIYLYLLKCLKQSEYRHVIMKKEEMDCSLSEEDIVIFLNEDERRAMQCLMQVELGQDEKPKNSERRERWTTCKSLLLQVLQQKSLSIVSKSINCSVFLDRCIDKKASILFCELRKNCNYHLL